jgi:hypothetical protein
MRWWVLLVVFMALPAHAAAQARLSDADRARARRAAVAACEGAQSDACDAFHEARARSDDEVTAGVTTLLVGILGFGGGALGLGFASELHGTVCTARTGLFWSDCASYGTGVIGHDSGLLAGSFVLAGIGLVGLIVGAFVTHVGRRRLADAQDVLRGVRVFGSMPERSRSRSDVSLARA